MSASAKINIRMGKLIPLFKPWVPEWLIKLVLFIVLLPSLVLFFLPLANIAAAAGYSGIEPADVQFSVVIFYAGYVSFFSLEQRFFRYLATKEYFFLITFIQLITSFICFTTTHLLVLLICRFIQGMAFTCTVNLSLALIFNRLRSERAREIGYAVFFGMLICIIPFNNFVTADVIDNFNFNTLYKCAMFSYIPSLVLLGVMMNNIRLNAKFPLYQLDWASFVIYAVILCLFGFMMVYGQQYYWLEDTRLLYAVLIAGLLLIIFIVRQFSMKRPYFQLRVFVSRNFKVGLLLLFILYICRFTSNIANAYFSTVLGLDPIHISHLMLFNIAGMVCSIIISCAMVLQKHPMRRIWAIGFGMLLIYHIWMYTLFSNAANENVFVLPLLLHGLGIGMLMTPTIVFVVASVQPQISSSAAGICLLVRFTGFCSSIALINYFELFSKSSHYATFQESLTRLNPAAKARILQQTHVLLSHGAQPDKAAKISSRLLLKSVNAQDQIRFAMDYFEMISAMLVLTLLLIFLFPYLNKTVLYLKKGLPAPF